MLRNREIRVLLACQLFFLAGGIAFTFYYGGLFPAIVAGTMGIFLVIAALAFTAWRYRELAKLSCELSRICAGEFALDVRNNEEGELSILRGDLYQVTRMLSKQSEQLRRDKESLADALSDISHQLKTPLTSMLVMTDLLNGGRLPIEKRQEFVKNIRTQLERIEWLVTSLLKLSKMDAGTITFAQETMCAAELAKQAAAPLLIPMELRAQILIIEGEEDVKATGDFHWTVEAMVNILKNAVEHCGQGGTIHIRFEENPIYTKIVIADNGEGIDRAELPFIFKRFYRGKNASEDSVGIGLAMAKSILEKQGGDLSVDSAPQLGTRFCLKFYKHIV